MPLGRYRVLDGEGNQIGTEDFRCAPGPMGWRYFSTVQITDPDRHTETIDVSVDASWRPVRVRIDTGTTHLLLRPREDRLEGIRDDDPVELPWGPGYEIDYRSPCFNAITANRLGKTAEFDVVYLDPVTGEPHAERQRYELEGNEDVSTPVGMFRARRWQYTALSSGWSRPLWVAGDTVVAYQGTYELISYEPGARGSVPRR